MGKKSKDKSTKKEDKPKKEVAVKASTTIQAALEANAQTSVKTNTAPARPNATKQTERRFDPTKVGCQEGFKWDHEQKFPELSPIVGMSDTQRLSNLLKMVRPWSSAQQEEKDRGSKLTGLHNCCSKGWGQYFRWRCGALNSRPRPDDVIKAAEMEGSQAVKDGLSSPVTIAGLYLQILFKMYGHKAVQLQEYLDTGLPLHLVVIGASAANEERILKETDYWDELGHLLAGRKVHLYLTGKEISRSYTKTRQNTEEGLDMVVECWRGAAIDFFLQKGRLHMFKHEETLVIGLNCGFGIAAEAILTGKQLAPNAPHISAEVLWSWLPTMYFLSSLDLPVAFTASSDLDAQGTASVLKKVVGMYGIVPEQTLLTPFESVVVGGVTDRPNRIRANSYGMVVRGQQPCGFPRISSIPDPDDPDARVTHFRDAIGGTPLGAGTEHACVRKDRASWDSAGQESPPPLKKYGRYPPEVVADVSVREDASDAAPANEVEEVLEDVPTSSVVEQECGHNDAPMPVQLHTSYDIHNTGQGFDILAVTLENVFLANTATARVGMRRKSFKIYYFDCQRCREVLFEGQLKDEVDHTTVNVQFRRSEAQIRITARLLNSLQ